MMDLGINQGMLVVQLVNIAMLTVLPALAITALVTLYRHRPNSDTAVAIWTLIILIIPVLGPIAYFMSRSIRPANQNKEQHV